MLLKSECAHLLHPSQQTRAIHHKGAEGRVHRVLPGKHHTGRFFLGALTPTCVSTLWWRLLYRSDTNRRQERSRATPVTTAAVYFLYLSADTRGDANLAYRRR